MAGGWSVPVEGALGDLVQRFREMERRVGELERPTGTQSAGAVAVLQQTVEELAAAQADLVTTQENLPVPAGYFADDSGFGLASTLFVDQTIVVPADKTRVVFTAVGNVAALDTTSGGLAVASAFIEVNGSGFVWSSPVVPASKDAGASSVNNIITPVLGFEQAGLTPGDSFLVSLNVSASNPSAFPVSGSNFATLAMTAIFFN